MSNLIVEFNGHEWCVVDADMWPCEENFYGLVSHGFESEWEARNYCTLVSLFPNQMCWRPKQ